MLGLFLSRSRGDSSNRKKKSRAKPEKARVPYFRRLRCEPLEYRRMLTVPAITGVNPAFPVATGSAQSFTINGSNFLSGCTVTLVDISQGTTFANRAISSQSATQIVINPNFGTAQDVWGVQVINPGSESSSQFDFALTPAGPPQPDRFGVDYSFARPAPASLQAAGSTFAVRYVSPAPNSKNISLSEAQSLQAAGQDIILVFESTASEMLNGYNAGVADANTAVSEATAAGAPSNFFCYFACDFDATPANQTPINAYLNGASSVLGLGRVGIYGGYYPVSRALTAGAASKGWQTVAWSGGLEDSRISLYQYATTILSNSSDVDVGIGSNLGQWSPATPTGLSASPTGIQTASISWNTAYVTTSYTLDRATSSSGPWTQVYSGASAQYSDTGLQFGTKYYYEVRANNGGGSSPFSSSVSATTNSGVPTGLAVAVTGPQSTSVSWNTVTGATSYTLQRATSSSGPWTQVYSGSTASYANGGLQPGTTYWYEVRSGTSTGSSASSSAVSATTTPTVTITSPSNGQVLTTNPITVNVTASDTGGPGLTDLTVSNTANGSTDYEWVSDSPATATFMASGIVLVPGQNVIDVEIFDNARHQSSVATVTVNYSPPPWSGGGANANWNTAANWSGTALVAGSDLVFAGSTGLNTTNNLTAGTQFGNLTFNAGAGAFILNGNSVDLSGVITNNSTNPETINLSLGGSYGLSKTGPGTVVLSASNSYTGGTVVTGGTLIVTTPAALPDGSNLSIGANVLVGPGTVVLSAANSFTGGAVVSGGTLIVTTPAALPNGSNLSVGANELALLGAAVVPSAAAGASQPSLTAIASPVSAASIRMSLLQNRAIQSAIVSRLARNAASFGIWADTQNTVEQQDKTTPALRAWDAALAEYGRG